MVRLLHTADWQLGLRLRFVPGEAAARLRAERFGAVERIAALAREERVAAVLVAGDVFDDNGVGPGTLQQARDALARFTVPVVLLPGNHDPATEGGALARLAQLIGSSCPQVRIALTAAPIAWPGFTVWPCPLGRRHAYEDPTAHLPPRTPGDGIRVALAHGGVADFGESGPRANRIDPERLLARGFDYLALGDWHGLQQVNDRAWYPGAPEATRFKEKRTGRVLLVTLDGPGAMPRVEERRVGRTRWEQAAFELTSDADVDGLEDWFAGLPEPSWSLVSLALDGALSLAARARLDDLLADVAARLAHLRIERDAIVAAPREDDLQALRGEGFLAEAIATLRRGADPADGDALRLLHRLAASAP